MDSLRRRKVLFNDRISFYAKDVPAMGYRIYFAKENSETLATKKLATE
jgi:hypothetical protein